MNSQADILEKYVDEFYEKHPTRRRELDSCLRRYRLADGSLQNDDSIKLDLRDLARFWKRKKPTLSRRGLRR
jgi:hypothetical protein